MIRSKYRRANPKNPVFSILRRFKMRNCLPFVFVFNCVFNLCTCSLLHEISSLTQLCIFKHVQRKMKNTGISGVARRYLLRINFLRIQINNNIPCLLAAQKQIIFRLKFLCASHWKIQHFQLPPCLQN